MVMLLIAFVAFFALVLAWLAAPTGEERAAPATAPKLATGEAPA